MRNRFRTLLQVALRGLLIAVWSVLVWAPTVEAQEGVRIELNKLEPRETACHAYLLLENRSSSSFRSLRLDLVIFNPDGIISRRLALEGGPLPAGKTTVKILPLESLSCDGVSRVLLNGVLNCSDGQGDREDCIQIIETVSRSDAEFFK